MFSLMEVISQECWNTQKIQHWLWPASHMMLIAVSTLQAAGVGVPKWNKCCGFRLGLWDSVTPPTWHTQDKGCLVSVAGMNPRTKDLNLSEIYKIHYDQAAVWWWDGNCHIKLVPGPLYRVRPDTCGGPARGSSRPATGGHLRWEQSAAHHRRAQATSPVIMPLWDCDSIGLHSVNM